MQGYSPKHFFTSQNLSCKKTNNGEALSEKGEAEIISLT